MNKKQSVGMLSYYPKNNNNQSIDVSNTRNKSNVSNPSKNHVSQRYQSQQKITSSDDLSRSNSSSSKDLLITSQSYCVYDCVSKTVLKGRKQNVRREVASLTKMMTLLTVIKLLARFNMNPAKTFITVSRSASIVTGTTANLKQGDILTVE